MAPELLQKKKRGSTLKDVRGAIPARPLQQISETAHESP